MVVANVEALKELQVLALSIAVAVWHNDGNGLSGKEAESVGIILG